MTTLEKGTALITGASAGIGKELAICCARNGHPLVLTARSEDKLLALAEELEAQYSVAVKVIPEDLSLAQAPERIREELKRERTTVEILINNAGFGSLGAFGSSRLESQLEMLRLNVCALTALTHLFLPDMLSRNRGRILNLASTAAFQPGPFMAVYYATKAYVLSFSEALAEELRGSGVTVTALCPGPTRSEFQARAKMQDSRLVRTGLAEASTVAEIGYRAMMHGRVVVVPGVFNRLLAQSIRITPRAIVRRVVRLLNGSVQ